MGNKQQQQQQQSSRQRNRTNGGECRFFFFFSSLLTPHKGVLAPMDGETNSRVVVVHWLWVVLREKDP